MPDGGQESAAAATTENTDGRFAAALILTGVAPAVACKVVAVFPPWIEGAREGERSTPAVTEALSSFIPELLPGGVFECTSLAVTVICSSFEVVLPTEEVVAALSRAKLSSGVEGLTGGESTVAGFS